MRNAECEWPMKRATLMRNDKAVRNACIVFLLISLLNTSPSFAEDTFSASGRFVLRGVEALQEGSVREDPSLTGMIKLDAASSPWSLHSRLEGGWDGTVRRPPRDRSLFKTYDEVYQSNTPYLEVKELFLSYWARDLELRAGIQRFAWGRIDEYPPNDLLNPWDYALFPKKPLEDRKIGVPSLSVIVTKGDWAFEPVWVPVFVPYRLPLPDERWSGVPVSSSLSRIPSAHVVSREPDLPRRSLDNGTVGMRMKYFGTIEWTLNLFHGYDPRPVFKTTELSIVSAGGTVTIDPGYVPDFHRVSTVGIDAAAVIGNVSLRAEIARAFNRYLDVRQELWGYPAIPSPGVYPLNPVEQKHDTMDYGIGADYRLFEDGQLTVQVQQTMTLGNVDFLYERKFETILWANLKASFMNQKIETNISFAYNPEHGDAMAKADGWYVFTDSWKAGITAVDLSGPPQSIFGRYARNDEVEAEIIYSW